MADIEEIDYERDSYEDIIAKDSRYDARAYALLMDCVSYVCREGKHASGTDILDDFRELAIEQFGPMTFSVLTEWGLESTEDIGEMMFNLAESRRISKDECDTADCFADGYDFKETFLLPYQK